MKRMMIAAALALGFGQVCAAEFGYLAAGAAEMKAAAADMAKTAPEPFPAAAREACPHGLEYKYLKFTADLTNAYVNRLISYNHYRLSQAAVGYAEGWSCESVGTSLDLAAGVLHEKVGDVICHSRRGKNAPSRAELPGAERVKSQQYPPELVARLYRFYDVLTNAYTNRLITRNHFHLTAAALMSAQKYSPGAVEHALDLSESFLKETLSTGKWSAIGGK